MSDVNETAGAASLERGINFITGRSGSNDILPQGTHHFIPIAPGGNKIQAGVSLPAVGPVFGPPSKANPLGDGFGTSLQP